MYVALRIILHVNVLYFAYRTESRYYLRGNQRASCHGEWLNKVAQVVGGGGDLPLNKTDDVEDGEVDEVLVFLFFLICPPLAFHKYVLQARVPAHQRSGLELF